MLSNDDGDQTSDKELEKARAGDIDALASAFETHRARLRRMVSARMDARLQSRFNESDVMQEVFIDVQRRIKEFQPEKVSFFVWLRSLTGQRLVDLHRFHFGAQKRSVGKELRQPKASPNASSMSLATYFIGQLTTASEAVIRDEVRAKVRAALDEMEEMDRELLSLRHFEQLSNAEAAESLGINASTASTRHLRAVKKLRDRLVTISELSDHTHRL